MTSRLERIGIPTKGRPRQLARTLESWLENARRHGRDPVFVVVDDAADPASTVAVCRRFERQYDVSVSVLDRGARRRWAHSIATRAGLPESLTEFALLGAEDCPITTGAARNTLLAASAGSLFLHVDDDVVAKTAIPPSSSNRLVITSKQSPLERWYFPDRDAALEWARFQTLDLVGLHERYLGRRVEDCLDDGPEQVDAALSNAFGAVIVRTETGILGDSGTQNNPYFALGRSARTRLLKSESFYRSAVASRQVAHCAVQPTLSNTPFCMMPCQGFDHRAALPPFLPVQRNSDGLFGFTLWLCEPASLTAFLPVAVLHEPPPRRGKPLEDLIRGHASLRLAGVVELVARGFSTDPRQDRTAAMRALGGHLSQCALAPEDQFQGLLLEASRHAGACELERVRRLAENPFVTPKFFADHLLDYAGILEGNLRRDDHVLPTDLVECVGPKRAPRRTQELVRDFGALLEVWPEFVLAARATAPVAF